jgi:hypothetical protein
VAHPDIDRAPLPVDALGVRVVTRIYGDRETSPRELGAVAEAMKSR